MKHLRAAIVLAVGLSLPLLSCAPNPAPERTAVHLPRGAAANLPLSDAILVGHTLYISGRAGLDPNRIRPRTQIELHPMSQAQAPNVCPPATVWKR